MESALLSISSELPHFLFPTDPTHFDGFSDAHAPPGVSEKHFRALSPQKDAAEKGTVLFPLPIVRLRKKGTPARSMKQL
jgi:hypothetical protein